jgi:hypothetical protein
MKTITTYKNLLHLQEFSKAVSKIEGISDYHPVLKLNRLVKKALKGLDEFNEIVEDLRIDYCEKENGRIVRVEGQLQWSAEGEKAFRKAYKALLSQEVEVNYDEALSYSELISVIPGALVEESNPWEDVEEFLSPFFVEK